MTKSIQVLLLYQMFSPQQPATMYHFQKKILKTNSAFSVLIFIFRKYFLDTTSLKESLKDLLRISSQNDQMIINQSKVKSLFVTSE